MRNTNKPYHKNYTQYIQRRLADYLETRYAAPVVIRKVTCERWDGATVAKAKYLILVKPPITLTEMFGVQRVGSATEIWPVSHDVGHTTETASGDEPEPALYL